MKSLDDELRTALRTKAHSLRVPERPALDHDIVEPHRRPRQRWLVAAACLALIAVGLVSFAQQSADDPLDVTSGGHDVTPPAPGVNGWVALTRTEAGDDDIYLVRPGEDARRLTVAGSDTSSEFCPAWSPDGARLLFGRLTGSSATAPGDADLVIVPVSQDGTAGAPTVIALDGFEPLAGNDPNLPPCGTWASDGRWVALRGRPDEVWVVDTQTSAIRRLPNLRPVDLEWRPGTDELAIAGDMGSTASSEQTSTPVTIYSVATGELRHLRSADAAYLTWSPDGSTLAYTGASRAAVRRFPADDEGDPSGLWLVDAHGTNERLLVADTGEANHGIGPVWSPAGDRIVYQRLCCGRAETHEVVLVNVSDGTETVVEPPEAEGSESVRWFPFRVSWSPDGTTLLYTAWRALSGPTPDPVDGRAHVITVRPDGPHDVTVLALGGSGHSQAWGRQPG